MFSYAVYVQKGGNWWVEKNFPANGKDAATDLANDISRTTPHFSVKVVREAYDDSTNTFTEVVVYKIDATKPPPLSSGALKGGGGGGGGASAGGGGAGGKAAAPAGKTAPAAGKGGKAAAKPAPAAKAKNTVQSKPLPENIGEPHEGRSLSQVLLMTVPLGIGCGVAVSALILYAGMRLGIPEIMEFLTTPATAFSYFFLSSVITTVLLIYKLEPDLLFAEEEPPELPRERLMAAPPPPPPEPDYPEPEPPPPPPKKEEPPPPKVEEKPPEPPPLPTDDVLATNTQAVDQNGGPDLEQLFRDSMALSLPPGQVPSRAQAFAFHVYLAGLSEEFATVKKWDDNARRAHLFRQVESLSASRERSAAFARNYDDYMATPYNQILRLAGRSAAKSFLAGVPGAENALGTALKDWMNAASGKGNQTAVVMFTDIVGSTDFAQTHGNEKALEQVRAHDQIIHAVFARHRGAMVKHTGDGVMATFVESTDAVRAAQQIQKAAQAHTRIMPDLPLRLRIGISADKAIRENDDIFGKAVQLAARLCAAAAPEQTVVSTGVVQGCEGQKDLGFVSLGAKQLKGFPEPVELYQAK